MARPPPCTYDREVHRLLVLLLVLGAATAEAKPRWQELPLPPAMPDSLEHGTVDVTGAHIYYARYGKADGPPVVLLHGGLGNSDHWSNQVTALADKFAITVIDSRGQGRSTRTKAPVTYDVMASDVLAVMDHLKLERASLVGWSDGGEIAMKIAIAHPERVDKLFIFGVNYDSNGSKPRGSSSATFPAYASKCRADYAKMSATPRAWDSLVDWLLPVWRTPAGPRNCSPASPKPRPGSTAAGSPTGCRRWRPTGQSPTRRRSSSGTDSPARTR